MTGIPLVAIIALSKLKTVGATAAVLGTPFIPAGMFSKAVFLILPFLLSISVSYDAYMCFQSAKSARVTAPKPAFFPVTIDPAICNGGNRCVDACPIDVFAPNPEPGKVPLVLFPGECRQEGSCVAICPQKGAMRWIRQPNQRVLCRREATGEDFFI